jgi:N-acetylated-alpha-linked acidic dipeptidase
MPRTLRIASVACLAVAGLAMGPAESAVMHGYSTQAATVQRGWEAKFRAMPDPANLRAYMQHLSARPHHLGSPYDKENAEWILEHFKQWGWDAQIETFEVLFPTPKTRRVELIEPTRYVATLREPALDVDPTSSQQSEQLPTYNAYSADGDVTAPLVYVNQGVPKDYDELERLGISVQGAIVIARYGGSWRGIKPKVAAEHGAVGCILFSDPIDDGYVQGDVFPDGAWRPAFGVQRGSVMDMPLYPGDPQTPGKPSTPDAKRILLKDLKTLTSIPVLPMSYDDAKPLLAALGGRVAPAGWRGGLPLTYHVGPGPAKVHLVVESDWKRVKLYDVIARLEGAKYPNEWVLRGNHFDAWVNGAEDPISGQVVLLEEARALGELVKQGWQPDRTIIYAAWDGEEEGLLGSTEWAEAHADELRRKAVAYINTDGTDRGYLHWGGSHTLERFINGVAHDVQDPETGLDVVERLRLKRIRDAKRGEEGDEDREELRTRPDLRIHAMGSGSDYTVFIDHLGVASLGMYYAGEGDDGGIYHSIYDDFYWYTHFSDTNFVYGRALAQTVGGAVIRLADAQLLPFDFDGLADTVGKYVDEVKKLAADKRAEIIERNKQLDEGVFDATNDPQRPEVSPRHEEVPPYLNFAPLENGLSALKTAAEAYQVAENKIEANGGARLDGAGPDGAGLRAINQRLIDSERRLTRDDGLPGRPWFKHQLYAPGFYTGYGVKTLPGVREAIEQKDWKLAEAQAVRVGDTLQSEANLILEAAVELEKLAPGPKLGSAR